MSNNSPIKNLKKYWVVVSRYGHAWYGSINYLRKDSIDFFVSDTSFRNWAEAKKEGWRVAKVDIQFTELKAPQPQQ